MSQNKNNRRAFLRGAGGVIIALPFAEFVFDTGRFNSVIAQEASASTPRLVAISGISSAKSETKA